MAGLENDAVIQPNLAESEEQLANVQQSGTQFAWTTDGEGQIQWVDGRGSKFLGESIVDLEWSRVPVLHPDDREQVERLWKHALSHASAYESEHRLCGHDGEYRWFSAQAFPLQDEKGQLIRWFGSSADIHEVKLAEQAFRETEFRIGEALGIQGFHEEGAATPDLARVLTAHSIQHLVDSLHALTGIVVLVQDMNRMPLVRTEIPRMRICDLHRTHSETRQQCIESDRLLIEGTSPGQTRIQECKNGLWDMAAPLVVNGRRVGTIMSGQFLFEGDEPDRDVFRARARRFGFDEEDYLAALGEIPRLSRDIVEERMLLLATLANLVSGLCYDRIMIDRLLAQRSLLADHIGTQPVANSSVEALARIGSWRLEVDSQRLLLSDEACRIIGMPEMTRLTLDEALTIVLPEDRQRLRDALTGCDSDSLDVEPRILVEENHRQVRVRGRLERDEEGRLTGAFGLLRDVTRPE